MFSILYFPILSALATPSPFGHPAQARLYLDLVCSGNIRGASRMTSCWTDKGAPAGFQEFASYGLQLHADLQLILNREEEAETNYYRCQKLFRSSKRTIRVLSCRNLAWQSLFRYRLSTAIACFSRVVDEPGVEPARAAEARFGITLALHELGRTAEAQTALTELAEQVCADFGGANHGAHWRDLIATLRFDLGIQEAVRGSNRLDDHVYWRSSLAADIKCASAHNDGFSPRAPGLPVRPRAPVLQARVDYLRSLRDVSRVTGNVIEECFLHLKWAHDEEIRLYQKTLRLEIALAALAGASPEHASAMLEPLHPPATHRGMTLSHLEYLYCAAKTSEALGDMRESHRLFSLYALVAMQCLRQAPELPVPARRKAATLVSQSDDVTARLPARYRRAYLYMLDNLSRRSLSVREVAAEINVSERALQSAFKQFLGLSPSELMRRQRMDLIRAELTTKSQPADRAVMTAGMKWGVRNHTTLVNGYRKQFDETPSETRDQR